MDQAAAPTKTRQDGTLGGQDEELVAARRRLFDPCSPAFVQDPYATYRVLRERQPLCYRPKIQGWIATRYHDIHAVLRDPRFERDMAPTFEALHGAGINDAPVVRNWNRTMLLRGEPDHGRLRNLVNRSFNARRMFALRESVAAIAHGLIDRMPTAGEVDLMDDFARVLPVVVICELLGIPEVDRQRFIDERVISERVFQAPAMTRAELDNENGRLMELRDYFLSLCAERRLAPREDLLSDLARAHHQGGLDEDELVAMVWLIFSAGHETTVNLIGNALVALHRHPDQLALLRAEPELWPQAIDELLRYDGSVQSSDRRALETVELSGQRIEAGQTVVCVLGAANRDPEVYADPDRLDLRRHGIKSLAFGGGSHFCLGAQLARLEGQIALGALLSRLPELSLPELDCPAWSPNVFFRGLETLKGCYPRRLDTRQDLVGWARPARVAEPSATHRPASKANRAAGCPFHPAG